MTRFCKKCRKCTKHEKLKPAGFFTDCIIAAITKFSVDLRDDTVKCKECGNSEST